MTWAATDPVVPGANQLTVDWDAPTNGADSYRVQWKTGAGSFVTSPEIPGADTRYVIQDLQAQTEYKVRVYASNASGNGQASSEQTGVPLEPAKGQVSGVQVTEGVEQLTISWNQVTGATRYRVVWKKESQSSYDLLGTETPPRKAEVSGLSHTIMDLEGGTAYMVLVTALALPSEEAGQPPEDGPDSDEAVGTPGLGKVSDLQVTRVDVDFLTVEWEAVTGTGVSYKVQWKSGTMTTTAETGEELDVRSIGTWYTYTISPLDAGTEYDIQVIATKGGREGDPSEAAMATTKDRSESGSRHGPGAWRHPTHGNLGGGYGGPRLQGAVERTEPGIQPDRAPDGSRPQ